MIGPVTGTRVVIAAAAAVTLLLGLAACSSDDPEPRVAPPTSQAPSSTSPTPVETLNPEETVRAWVEARNRALATGDLSDVRSLSSSACRSCQGLLGPIEKVYADGGRFETDGWEVVASRVKSQTSTAATVPTGLSFAGGTTVPEAGADPVVYSSEKHVVVFKLTKHAEHWQVSFVGFLS